MRKAKIGAKSEHFCHLPRYRSTAPIIGAAKDSAAKDSAPDRQWNTGPGHPLQVQLCIYETLDKDMARWYSHAHRSLPGDK